MPANVVKRFSRIQKLGGVDQPVSIIRIIGGSIMTIEFVVEKKK